MRERGGNSPKHQEEASAEKIGATTTKDTATIAKSAHSGCRARCGHSRSLQHMRMPLLRAVPRCASPFTAPAPRSLRRSPSTRAVAANSMVASSGECEPAARAALLEAVARGRVPPPAPQVRRACVACMFHILEASYYSLRELWRSLPVQVTTHASPAGAAVASCDTQC